MIKSLSISIGEIQVKPILEISSLDTIPAKLPANCGRQRLNLNGAIDAESHEAIVINSTTITIRAFQNSRNNDSSFSNA
jgi:hypothetical protein